MTNLQKRSEQIKQKAIELGFSAIGIARARSLEEQREGLNSFLDKKYHGKMGYLANHFEKRLDPRLMIDGTKSVIVVLLNYFPQQLQCGKNLPIISKYAYGKDYHLIVKDKLKELYNFINDEIASVSGRFFTDSAPVLERYWAVEAGLGWIGKNGLLLNKELGSYFFIGELILDLDLEYDQPFEKEYCGSCNQCLSACPTQAFEKPYILNASRCISYLTIELKDTIPEEFHSKLMRRVYGCDICQDVCPWNQKPQKHKVASFDPHDDLLAFNSDRWQSLTKEEFNNIFNNSAVHRAGYKKLKENIEIVLSKKD